MYSLLAGYLENADANERNDGQCQSNSPLCVNGYGMVSHESDPAMVIHESDHARANHESDHATAHHESDHAAVNHENDHATTHESGRRALQTSHRVSGLHASVNDPTVC